MANINIIVPRAIENGKGGLEWLLTRGKAELFVSGPEGVVTSDWEAEHAVQALQLRVLMYDSAPHQRQGAYPAWESQVGTPY